MKIKDLRKMSKEDRLKLAGMKKCKCGANVETDKCSDCYYKEFGEEVEQFPVGIPRMHRGAQIGENANINDNLVFDVFF